MLAAIFFNRRSYKSAFMSFLEFLVLFFILPLVTCSLWGQVVQKIKLTPDFYGQWGEVHLDNISPDENWASYNIRYENNDDTLFVRNIVSSKTFGFPKAKNGSFNIDNIFFCQIANDLHLLNLSTGKKEIIPDIQKFVYSAETDQLIVLFGPGIKNNTLLIRSLHKNSSVEATDIVEFSISKSGNWLAYIEGLGPNKKVIITNLKNEEHSKKIVAENAYFSNLTWDKNGYSLAFIKGNIHLKISALCYYLLAQKKLYVLNSSLKPDPLIGDISLYAEGSQILISDDLRRVFFSIKTEVANTENKQDSKVEIWNTEDKLIYPQQSNLDKFDKQLKLVLWKPFLNQIKIITSDELPNIILNSDLQYAILSNHKDYEPQFEFTAPRDFYILNLNTFEKKIFLKKHIFSPLCFNASPGGKYFAYFKNNNWWVYNFKTGTHKNITVATGGKFTAKQNSLVPESICGNPGWSKNDKEIILYDQNDLWAISPNGNSFERLTKGREINIKYRIAPSSNKFGINYLFDGLILDVFDLKEGLILSAKGDDEKTGYFSWNSVTGEKSIIYKNSFIDELNYGRKKKNFFFREQKFDVPPKLAITNNTTSTNYFFNSNAHHQKYFWGKSELIEYQNSKGQKLKGALFYPADYNPEKKYPMIVNVYEIKSSELHVYRNPSYYEPNGFNLSIMTSEGYFVLLPDITLEYQNPGISAADCVVAATKKILEFNIVDPNKIGLMGHSFGGYESAFIITQTNLFAAAIASGAITDLVSYYHTINQGTGKPDMWRFQNEQWNMGKPPYQIPEVYYTNSPINFAENIQTPVLLWSGKNDFQVDTHQSKEFYLALRRLGKKGIMLLYPGQGHLIINSEQQKDLTYRTLQWFNHFLKENNKSEWISKELK